jgi:tetratricopeptide (TPR) repeat protein
LFLPDETASMTGMNRFFTLFASGLFLVGTSVVCDAGMAPGPGQQQAPQDLSQRTQSQPSPQQTPQQKPQQKGPDAVTPYNEGIGFMKAKNYRAAVPKFEAALKANPNLPQAHLLAAFCLRKLGSANYSASLEHLNAALKLNPNMGEAYESRGVLYVKMGRKEDAQKDLATLKHLNPKLTPGLEAAIKTGKDVDTY